MDTATRAARLKELAALRNHDPDEITKAYRRAMLGLGNLPPAPYLSFSRMIDAIVAYEEQQAKLSDQRQ
jgi:hypothetical protein